MTRDQCDARRLPSQLQGHRRLTATKLYCLVTEAYAYEQLAQGCYMKVERPVVEPATFCAASQHPNHYTTTAHSYIQQAQQRHVVHQ